MDEKKFKNVAVIVGGAVVLYFAYKYFTRDSEDEVVEEELITTLEDNPGPGEVYGGDKPRSEGNSTTTTTVVEPGPEYSICVPAMESEGGGKGKYISVDDPHTPKQVESDRRQIINANLNVGNTIYLDGRPCQIKKFWVDSSDRKAAIQCEDHTNITYNDNSKICW